MFRALKYVSTGGALAAAGYLGGSSLRPLQYQPVFERDESKSKEFRHIYGHPAVKRLRQEQYHESRYYDKIPLQHRENMVTSGLLAGAHALTVEPFVFTNQDETEAVFFYHVGDKVAGHEGIVHGGLTATLLDEGLSRCAFPSLPNKYGVTASLDVDYRAPVRSNSYLMLKTKVAECKGRKCVVRGQLYSLNDDDDGSKPLAEGTAVMIEPKWAKYFLWILN